MTSEATFNFGGSSGNETFNGIHLLPVVLLRVHLDVQVSPQGIECLWFFFPPLTAYAFFLAFFSQFLLPAPLDIVFAKRRREGREREKKSKKHSCFT